MVRPLCAALLLIGDELLSGKIRDENGALAIAKLRERGIDLIEVRIVPDRSFAISSAVLELKHRADVVITSGGIGPTHDDITLASIAAAFGVGMREAPELRAWIDNHFASRPKELKVWRRMAMVPEGAVIHMGERMLWPLTEVNGVYVLPGVPQLFANQLRAVLDRLAGQPVGLTNLYLSCGEGEVAVHLEEAVAAESEVAFGSYPVWGADDYRTKVTVESRDRAALDRAVAMLVDRLGWALVRTEREG